MKNARFYLAMQDDNWRWQERCLCPASTEARSYGFDPRTSKEHRDGKILIRVFLQDRPSTVTAIKIIVQLVTSLLFVTVCCIMRLTFVV